MLLCVQGSWSVPTFGYTKQVLAPDQPFGQSTCSNVTITSPDTTRARGSMFFFEAIFLLHRTIAAVMFPVYQNRVMIGTTIPYKMNALSVAKHWSLVRVVSIVVTFIMTTLTDSQNVMMYNTICVPLMCVHIQFIT